MTVMKFSRTSLLNCFLFFASLILSTLRLKVKLARFYAFFHKKKSLCYKMTHYFADVLYLSICMLGNCSCFYFRLLTFLKIKFLKIKPPRTTIRVSNSLDPDQDRHSVGLHLSSNCLQRAIGRRQNYPLACKEL